MWINRFLARLLVISSHLLDLSAHQVYSPTNPRSYRIMVLVTATLSLMFTNAVLYNVSYDTSVCDDITTQATCESTTYTFSSDCACSYDPSTSKAPTLALLRFP